MNLLYNSKAGLPMNLNRTIIFMIIAFLIWGCTNKKSDTSESLQRNLSSEFPTVQIVKDSVIEVNQPMDIEKMAMTDEGMIVMSLGTPNIFYIFDPESLQLTDSIGRMGNGEGEYLFPNLVSSHSGAAMVIDNGKQLITRIQGSKAKTRKINLVYLVNSPVSAGSSLIAYEELKRDNREIKIMDVDREVYTDSMTLALDPKLPKDIKIDANGKHLAVAHMFGNRLDILTLTKEGSIAKKLSLIGERFTSSEHASLVDVACGNENVYLLSMKDVEYNGKAREGAAAIEVYNYEGDPVRKMILDFFPRRILLDEKRGRIVAQSKQDDNFHIIPVQ